MNANLIIFLYGIVLLALFLWYFGAERVRQKRLIGTILSVLIAGFCLYAVNPPQEKLKRGIDLQGGSSFTVRLDPTVGDDGKPKAVTPGAVNQAIAILSRRLDADSTKDLLIAPQGEDRVLIQMPGISEEEAQEVREKIQQTARLEVRGVHENSRALLAQMKANGGITPGWMEMPAREPKPDEAESWLVTLRPELDGSALAKAYAYLDPQNSWTVGLEYTSEGGKKFDEIAQRYFGKPTAIIIDGEVESVVNINSKYFGGRAVITGDYTEGEARQLASVLENPLQNSLVIEEESQVSATYGANTIQQGIKAGLTGLAVTLLFMLVYYRAAGVIALLGLLINILILFGCLAIFEFTLTMPGIAGILLTIGVAVDANVLIYERLREEIKAGKSISGAIQSAYEKAFSAIFDANITTLITSLILFVVASGLIKGFAITLTIGVLASLFSALLVTRVCFWWAEKFGLLKAVALSANKEAPKFDVLGKRKFAMVVSLFLLFISIGALVMKGKDAVGIDFRGGAVTKLELKKGATVEKEAILKALEGKTYTKENDEGVEETLPLGEVYVQQQSTPARTFMTVRSEFDAGKTVEAELKKSFAEQSEGVSVNRMGSLIGGELATKSVLALILGLIGILIYVTLRFEFSFALGALIALFHDLAICIGIITLFNMQLSLILVGAFLTIAGYSINDTIVIFDRIRENLRLKRGDVKDLMNQAINSTLRRTMLTSMTTLVMVVTLFIFGGPSLKDFSLTIILGVLVGTYSSLFVASPVVLWWARSRGKNLRREVLDAELEQLETASMQQQ